MGGHRVLYRDYVLGLTLGRFPIYGCNNWVAVEDLNLVTIVGIYTK